MLPAAEDRPGLASHDTPQARESNEQISHCYLRCDRGHTHPHYVATPVETRERLALKGVERVNF